MKIALLRNATGTRSPSEVAKHVAKSALRGEKTSHARLQEKSKSLLSEELYSQPPSCQELRALRVSSLETKALKIAAKLHTCMMPLRIKRDFLVRSRLGNDNQTGNLGRYEVLSSELVLSVSGKKMRRSAV